MNVLVDQLSPDKITKTLMGSKNATLTAHFKDQDSNQVKYGKTKHVEFADVYSPKGQKKIRVTFDPKKGQKLRISSSLVKRMELEHIEETIEQLNIVPDFGFPLLQYDMDELKGYDLIRDHIQNHSKYERVNNFIDAQKYKLELAAKQKFLELSK